MSAHNQPSLSFALARLQHIFPTLTLNKTHHHRASLHQILNQVTHSLPVPDACNSSAALETMRQIIDQQEYKYQRSLIRDAQYEQSKIFQEEDCFYEDASTGILHKKDTKYTSCEENKCDMVDDVWGWKEEKNDPREEYLLFID